MRRRAGVLLILGAVLGAPRAVGQTKFQWPEPDTVSLARYTTLEECQVLVWRMRDALLIQERLTSGTAWDTLPYDPRKSREANRPQVPPSPAIVQMAQRCMARFAAVDSVPLDRLDEYIEMYMHAGWDTKIQALVDRRMALADGSKEIHAVFDTLRQLGTGFGFTRWGYGMGRPWGNMSQWYGQARWDSLFEAILTQQAPREPDPVAPAA